MRPAWAEVSIEALKFNIRSLKSCIDKDIDFMGVIKADAYGHGVIKVAQVLVEEGVKRFAVIMVEEAIELRKNNFNQPILILGHVPEDDYINIVDYNLIPVIYKYSQAEKLNKIAKDRDKTVDIHIKIDTGMGRLGFMPKLESIEEIEKINSLSNINMEGIYTHLSTADEKDNPFALEQLGKFEFILQELEKKNIHIPIKHMANSAANINFKNMHFNMVRPGTSLYGLYPGPKMAVNPRVALEPVMSIKSRLVHIKELEVGSSVSYGRTFIAKRPSLIGVVPMGYVDGVFRALGNRGDVLIKGKRCPIIGNICMDQLMVDLTDLEHVDLGDEVVILGKQGQERISAEEIGEIAGTISIEVVTRIGKRVPIIYT